MVYAPRDDHPRAFGWVLGILLVILLSLPFWLTGWSDARETYFDMVFRRCARTNGLANPRWEKPRSIWFDASAREFIPTDARGFATVACTRRWAGFLIGRGGSAPGHLKVCVESLRVVVAEDNVSLPRRISIESFQAHDPAISPPNGI